MTRKIQSINTISNKYEFTVYVNFENGTFGTHTKNIETGKWFDSGLNADELKEAKKVGIVDGKWLKSWKAPRQASVVSASNHAVRCPDCGHYDCGSNCNSNRF